MKSNRIISSLLHLKALVRLQPENIQNKFNIANAFSRLKQYALAIQALESMRIQFPDNKNISTRLAEAYYRINDFAQAIEQYR